MAMLAEPRRKQRIGPNPRGKFFTDDQDNRGRQMLEKMGWKSGDGLGANSQGMNEPIKPKVHTDARGLGFDKKTDPWVAHNEEFEQLLKSLNSSNSNGTDGGEIQRSKESNSAADEDSSGIINGSLENKSKTLRSRIHYHKFVKNKDLSRASSKDISCIFGKSIDKLGNVSDSPNEETSKSEKASDEPQVQLPPSEPVVNDYLDEKVKKKKKKKRDRDGDSSKDESTDIVNGDESYIAVTLATNKSVDQELDVKLDGDSEGGKKKKRRRDKGTDSVGKSEEEEAVSAIDIEKPALSNQSLEVKTTKKKKRDRDVGFNKDASTDIAGADESYIAVTLPANVGQELDVKLENDSERRKKKKRRKDKETEGINKSEEESVPLIQNDIENPALPEEDNSGKKKKRKSKLKVEDEEEKSKNVVTTTEIPVEEDDSSLDSSQNRKKKKSKKRKLDAAEDVCNDTIQESITEKVNIDEDDSQPKKKKKKKSRKGMNEDSVDCVTSTHVTSPLESNTNEDPTTSDSKTNEEPTKPIENSETYGSMQFINRGSLEDYFRNKRLQMLNRKLSK